MKKLILKKEEYLLKKELYELQSEELSKIELTPDMEKEVTSRFNLLSNSKIIKQNIYGDKIVIGMGAGSISSWMRKLPKLF